MISMYCISRLSLRFAVVLRAPLSSKRNFCTCWIAQNDCMESLESTAQGAPATQLCAVVAGALPWQRV